MGFTGDAHSRERSWRLLAVIVVVAVLVRLAFWFVVVGFDTTGGGDGPDYHQLASGVAAGQGLLSPEGEPTARRPPLYPMLLGGFYSIAGPDPDVGRGLQVALGALIVVLVYALARRLFSERVALLAAALVAVNPSLVYVSALLLTENLYIVLLLLALLALMGVHEPASAGPGPAGEGALAGSGSFAAASARAGLGRFAGAGFLTGLCALARPTGLAFTLVAGLATLLFLKASVGRRIAATVVFLAVAAATVAPWAVRNHAQLGEWVVSTTHGGITFYESNNPLICENPEFRGIVVLPRTAVPGWEELEGLAEVEFDREAWRMGLEFVRENTELLPRMALWKFVRFWRIRSGLGFGVAAGAGGGRGVLGALAARADFLSLYWAAVTPLFLLGLVVTLRRARRLLLPYAVILAHVLSALLIHGSLRARTPVEPMMAIFAAAAAGWCVARLRGLRRPRAKPAT